MALNPAKCPHDSTPFTRSNQLAQSYTLRDALEAIAAAEVKSTAAVAAAAEEVCQLEIVQQQFLADAHLLKAPPTILNPRLEWNVSTV